MKIEWNFIKVKYPKAFGQFTSSDNDRKVWYDNFGNIINISYLNNVYTEDYRQLCFCDFVKFFNYNNLILIVDLHSVYEKYVYRIYSKIEKRIAYDSEGILQAVDRKHIEEDCVVEAFRILEGML